MEEENIVPKMLELLFGDAAGAAMQIAPPRLLLWCRAFDDWLAERSLTQKPRTIESLVQAWRLLFHRYHKMPWEISREDIEAHAAWMQAQGYADSMTAQTVGKVASFYRWCDEHRVDPQCAPGFNPATSVARPKVRPYDRAVLLNRGEVQALLDILQRDCTPLGRREYAFFLARLRLGVPLSDLRRLQWGQISRVVEESSSPVVGEEGKAWVQWRPGEAPTPLPAEVWQAILDYLQASGRLAGMQAEFYIFAPLAEPGKEERGSAAQDWLEERPLVRRTILENLKIYGRPAGIPEEKLNLQALRRTAIRLRMDGDASIRGAASSDASIGDASIGEINTGDIDTGDSRNEPPTEAMQSFLESREEPRHTKRRLHLLPQLPPNQERPEERAAEEPPVPDRTSKLFKPGERVIHGFYARNQPMQEVLNILAEDIKGMEEEFAAIRQLGRGVIERIKGAGEVEMRPLGETYSTVAHRVSEFIEDEKRQAAQGKEDPWAEELLAMLDAVQQENGGEPISDQVRQEAQGTGSGLSARRTAEEIASTRYVLRNTYRVAMAARKNKDYVRMVNLYCKAFLRLMRLLKAERGENERLEVYLEEAIDRALLELTEELGLRD